MTTLTLPPLRSKRVGFLDASRRFWLHAERFGGRSSRSEYWWAILHLVIVTNVLGITALILQSTLAPAGDFAVNLIVPAFALVTILPSLALQARRLHDINRSAWWILLGFVPFGSIVVLVFTLLPGTDGENRFDTAPPTRRVLSPLRRVGSVLAAIAGAQYLIFIVAALSAFSSGMLVGLNRWLVELGEPAAPTAVSVPGVFTLDAAAPANGFEFTFHANPVGWILTGLAITALSLIWDAAIRRHERRVAVTPAQAARGAS